MALLVLFTGLLYHLPPLGYVGPHRGQAASELEGGGMKKRLPPFGATLVGAPIDDKDIYVCTRWDLVKNRRRIVVPSDRRPETLDLAWLRGRSVVLFHRSDDDEQHLVALVGEIAKARPARLVLIDVDWGCASFVLVAADRRAA